MSGMEHDKASIPADAGRTPPSNADNTLLVLMAAHAQARISMQVAAAEAARTDAEAANFAAQATITSRANAALLTAAQAASILLKAIILRGEKVPDGRLIEVLAPPWFAIFRELRRDPRFMYNIPPDKFEEFLAGAYDLAGYKTILTPRSGDLGRDLIATRDDGVLVKILDQAKRYGPGQQVDYDAIRAMLFVLDADKASKGFLTTTGTFPPDVMKDRLIAPLIGKRLELVPGTDLVSRLELLSHDAAESDP